MAGIVFLLAVLLFAFGVLIGSVLHTQALDRRYRQITHRVRELHELETALAEREETLAGVSHRPAIYREPRPEPLRDEVAC